MALSLADQIAADAAKAKRVEIDGQVIERRPIADQIAAAQFGAANRAAANGAPFFGMRVAKIIPGGCG